MSKSNRRVVFYGVYGLLVGIFFPAFATGIQLSRFGLELTWKNLQVIHLSEPLLVIIDVTPIVLCASFALIGIQSARFQKTSNELAQQVAKGISKSEYESYFLEALISSSSFAIVRLDTNHHIITCNKQFEELFGYKCSEINGRQLDDLIAPKDLFDEASSISESVSKGNLERLISRRRRKDGSPIDVEIVGIPVSVDGEKIGILGLYHDISSRIRAEQALEESESRFKSLFQDSPISLWEEDFSGAKAILDPLGSREQIIDRLYHDPQLVFECMKAIKILDVNQATLDLYNANSKEDLLVGLDKILVEDSLDAFRGEIISLVKGEFSFDCEISQRKISGELIKAWLRLSLPQEYRDSWERVYISIMDITERKKIEEKMRYMSFHDALTGLYNRAYFEEELSRLGDSRQYPITIVACDLDNLKTINDSYGHEAGDQAIKAAAKILGTGKFRKEDVVARTGGDEFMVILPALDINKNPVVLQRINDALARHNSSTEQDGLYRPISISVGSAVVYQDESLEDGCKRADAAMYEAKLAQKIAGGPLSN